MKRIALLAAGVAAAASFVRPAPASADPPCWSQELSDCYEPYCLRLGIYCGPR